jgi:SOS response regulatory protein OraA/RecX
MAYYLRRSSLEPSYFEVCEGEMIVQEIWAPFQIRKIPSSFESLEEITRYLQETEWKLAKGAAYRYLAARSLASPMLMQKLKKKQFSEEVCRKVVEELEKLGYLQDDEFERSLILREFKRGYGPKVIELKLKAKGLGSRKVRELITREMQSEKLKEPADLAQGI